MAPPTTSRAALVLVALFVLTSLPVASAQSYSSYNGITMAVTPDALTSGSTNSVNVQLTGSFGTPLAGKKVNLCGPGLDSGFPTSPPVNLTQYGPNCPHFESTRSNGVATLSVRPFTNANVFVYVDDLYQYRVLSVYAGALQLSVSPASPTTADPVTLRVALPDGSTPSGSLVRLWRNGVLTHVDIPTNSNGLVSLGQLSAGSYEARATRSSYLDASLQFLVHEPAVADLQVTSSYVPSTVLVGDVVRTSVSVVNVGNAAGTGTVELLLNGQRLDGRSVTLEPSASTIVEMSFTPTVAGRFNVQFRVGASLSGAWSVTATERPSFVLDSVSVPLTAQAQESVTIQAVVRNPSGADGWARVYLNTTGSSTEWRDVYVTAGSSQTVAFSRTFRSLGEQSVRVAVGGNEISNTIVVQPQGPNFVLQSLVAPSQVLAGQSYSVSVDLENRGAASGTTLVEVMVNGISRASSSRTLRPGESVRLTYDLVAPTATGSYRIEVRADGSSIGPELLLVTPVPTPTAPTRVEVRASNGSSLSGATAILLAAGTDGALVTKGTRTVDPLGRLSLEGTSATYVAIPDRDGYAVLPIPTSGRITLPSSLRTATETFSEVDRADLATRFQDARVFPVSGASRRVTVGYAGVASVDIESTSTDARLVVARYGDKPLASIPAPPASAYRWFDLHLSRADGSDASFASATVRFTRPEGAEGALLLFHYSGATGAWETLAVTDDGTGTFSAAVGTFSLFAIGVEAPSAFGAPWVLPTLGALGLVAALGVGGLVVSRTRKARAHEAAMAAMAAPKPAETFHPIVATPAPPPPPPLVRRAAPRRPLAGDIHLTHVSVRTGGKTFLEDVSFRVPRGTITTLVGPPGAGKAMTLLAILGDVPHIGSIDVGGMDPAQDHADLKRSVGASAAGAQLDRERTVEEIFDAIADKRALPRIEARMRGERVLSLLGSSATGASRVGDLATPDERRVLIAAALVHEPELLLLDEPTLDLPPAERAALWSGLRRVREDLGLTVIATSQHPDDALASDGVVVLELGKVVAKGAPSAVAPHLREGPHH